jgi:para-nitrobenzyl esterase
MLLSRVALAQTAACIGSSDVPCTEQGAVRGVVQGATMAFKGIPYAAPPVGPLRWRPPGPAARWDGERDGSQFGAICPQIIGEEVMGDENCLYINVWRPREKPDRPLPVLVWLHGGGNHTRSGEGSADFGGVGYNGEQLVPQGGVFVSYNSRLGVLGFSHAALSTERPEKISGNYGSLDLIAMLQWINRNIPAFGGDPSRVFLLGPRQAVAISVR